MRRNRTPLRDFASDCNFYKMCNLKNVWVGLKIRRASALGGSTPPPGTILEPFAKRIFRRDLGLGCEQGSFAVFLTSAQYRAHPQLLCACPLCAAYGLGGPLAAHSSVRHRKRAFNGVGLRVDVPHGDNDAAVARDAGESVSVGPLLGKVGKCGVPEDVRLELLDTG